MTRLVAILLMVMIAISGFAVADRLPVATPENQLIATSEFIEVLGPIMKTVKFTSEHSDAYLHPGIVFGMDNNDQTFGESVAQTSYSDKVLSNGGMSTLTYTFGYNSGNMIDGVYNLETDSILTYESIDGSTLMALERASMDIVGNYQNTENVMRCVFASNDNTYVPAFCNKVTAESSLMGVTSMAVQSTLELRDTAPTTDVGGELRYKLNVDPVSGQDYANGVVNAEFTASIREANDFLDTNDDDTYYMPGATDWNRNYWDDEARVTNYDDSETIIGGITRLTKDFSYNSQVTF